MTHHLRPRTAHLTLELDPGAEPCGSALALATRAGEVVWQGDACADSWQAGLRLRARWQGQWSDALWAMTVAVLDAELTTHGLRREKRPDVDVAIHTHPGGTVLSVRCPVVPHLMGTPEWLLPSAHGSLASV
jgi:hypothetical protein